MLPANADRVPMNTADEVNQWIRRRTEANVARYAEMGREAIDRRLMELDYEWDTERCLETMASSLTLTGLVFGATINRKWFLLSAAVQSFFLQHALQGWCPPLPVMRRTGVRTMDEINDERMALKSLRGDFDQAETSAGARGSEQALAAARQ